MVTVVSVRSTWSIRAESKRTTPSMRATPTRARRPMAPTTAAPLWVGARESTSHMLAMADTPTSSRPICPEGGRGVEGGGLTWAARHASIIGPVVGGGTETGPMVGPSLTLGGSGPWCVAAHLGPGTVIIIRGRRARHDHRSAAFENPTELHRSVEGKRMSQPGLARSPTCTTRDATGRPDHLAAVPA
jgi:hypothetical protein